MLRRIASPTARILLTSPGHIDLIDASLASVKGAQQVISSISSRRAVTQLDLSHNRLGDEGCTVLFSFLCSDYGRTYGIQKIRLNSNAIGDAGLAAIVEYIANNVALKELYLQNNLFSGRDPSFCSRLAAALNSSCIEVFTLTTNRELSDGFLHHFLPNLDCPSLIELHLSDVGLTPLAAPTLVQFVASPRCQLHILKLNGNRLGFRGVRAIVRAIERSNYSLSTIEMYSNDSQDASADTSDVTSADDDDEIPNGLESWKENDKLLRPLMLRNQHLRRITQKEALSLLPVSRALLMQGRSPSIASNEATNPDHKETRDVFRFASLPTELQLYILSFLAPHLSPVQRSRIFTYASSRSTLPPLLSHLPSSRRIVPVAKNSTPIVDEIPASVEGYKAQPKNIWDGFRWKWLGSVGCLSFEPNGIL
ncbi:hypothetical protein HGRIS_011577 [Hohenbuehelia grisea]|uniref:RNI-like protein n=1 Tax=Hohenbuehelia grisea TaxID=104357 RepID=A0ABR3JXQ6_9AGAR